MNVDLIEVPQVGARQAAADYRRQAKRVSDPALARQFNAIAAAYMTAVREGQQLIALTSTIAKGGQVTRTVVFNRDTDREKRETYTLPAVAAVRADSRYVYTRGLRRNGFVELIDSLGRRDSYEAGRLDLQVGWELPHGHTEGMGLRTGWSRTPCWSALVPLVPPKHWPPRTTTLRSRLVLFEVEDWTWHTPPPPPGDPALLRHLAGDLYVVEAMWDLTPLERAVLGAGSGS